MNNQPARMIHLGVTILWLLIAVWMIFFYAPREATMGEVQRIFYIHVPAGWTAFLAYFIVFVGSVIFLAKRSQAADDLAHAAAEVGFVFCTSMIVTGPLWAKPAWGIWWTWDARLTMSFLLWLLYVSYLMLRSYVFNPGRSALLAAVVGIIGFVDVPVNYMAIRWWRTQHPQPVIGGGEGSGLEPAMRLTLYFCAGAFWCLFAYLVRERLAIARLRRELSAARRASAPQDQKEDRG
ncbi:MAG: cytochrome c biogenesis protein CcsA [Acidobacteria bacterium]|nr:cytochrome c biogenesis protein CcsA [Acidobacteriota bacterium]